ncbi:hypothetical protein BD410DRAFT_868659 [Rickenella mellea]|uniref:Peptidase A1 domain-containing protein n=1 Tax=Rickenella mellea TaxID=50990 RepID=A0A4Y7PH54_9AGAM|nr:hypothetical protein BD410DRAFT_868659 [Rickenella mellea]
MAKVPEPIEVHLGSPKITADGMEEQLFHDQVRQLRLSKYINAALGRKVEAQGIDAKVRGVQATRVLGLKKRPPGMNLATYDGYYSINVQVPMKVQGKSPPYVIMALHIDTGSNLSTLGERKIHIEGEEKEYIPPDMPKRTDYHGFKCKGEYMIGPNGGEKLDGIIHDLTGLKIPGSEFEFDLTACVIKPRVRPVTDGIFGLGREALTNQYDYEFDGNIVMEPQPTLIANAFDEIMKKNPALVPVIGFYFLPLNAENVNQEPKTAKQVGSHLTIGKIAHKYIEGGEAGINWVKLLHDDTGKMQYKFFMEGISCGTHEDEKIKFQKPDRNAHSEGHENKPTSNIFAIIDTGCQSIFMDQDLFHRYATCIGGAYMPQIGYYAVTEEQFKTMPDLVFHIGGKSYSLDRHSQVMPLKLWPPYWHGFDAMKDLQVLVSQPYVSGSKLGDIDVLLGAAFMSHFICHIHMPYKKKFTEEMFGIAHQLK